MRVLNVSRWLAASGGGGIQTFLSVSARAVQSRKILYSYSALMPGGVPEYASVGLDVHLGKNGASNLRNSLYLWRWLRASLADIDVVHIHGVLSYQFLVASIACLVMKVPYTVSPHGSLDPWFISQRRTKALLYLNSIGRYLLRRADSIMVTTDMEAGYVKSVDENLVTEIVFPGIDIPDNNNKTRRDSRRDSVLRIVYMSRLSVKKGLPRLLQALAILRDNQVKFELHVVGSGEPDYEAKIRKIVETLNLDNFVIFYGYLSGKNKVDVMQNSDVYVLHSDSENFGFTVAEAMALGLPVVISNRVALADVVEKYRAGSVVPVESVELLASSLMEYSSPRTQEERGSRAYDAAVHEFSLSQMGGNLEKLYRRALKRYMR